MQIELIKIDRKKKPIHLSKRQILIKDPIHPYKMTNHYYQGHPLLVKSISV